MAGDGVGRGAATVTEQDWTSAWIDDAERPADPMEELAITLGMEIRELREGLGWSRSVLVRRSGTARSWLTRLEDGNGLPSVVVLQRLASVMGKRVWITLIDERDRLPPRCSTGKEAEGG
jgi:ribosome-binding protein aMBF1 (putative translation factor)